MKKLSFIVLIILAFICFYIFFKKKSDHIVIGVVLPLEHRAMGEIVSGLSETLSKKYNKKYEIKIENAQNDNNLLRAILQKMKDAHYDLIVPIGTMPTQMAISIIHNKPIISLASVITDEDRKKLSSCNLAVIHDEIPAEKSIKFIHEVYPHITKLSLLHSSSDKVLPEVTKTIAIANSYGITVQHFMVNSLPDLMSSLQALPRDTQGLFVLKDHLLVSGMSTLSKISIERQIPLITSDEGSVENGASFALGVREKQIGVEGANLILKVLEGSSACTIPIIEMSNLNIFVNRKVLLKQNLSENPIQKAAALLNYKIDFINFSALELKK